MRVTSADGVTVDGRYPNGMYGRALPRRDLDWMLLQHAVDAGAMFEPGLAAREPIVSANGTRVVGGVLAGGRHGDRLLPARVTIAADGRRSTLAFGLGLARLAAAPRRWAVGGYFERVGGLTSLGEMHVRRDCYIGVAPMPGGRANVCVVRPSRAGDPALRDPSSLIDACVSRDPLLRDRFASSCRVAAPIVVGPLAIESTGVSIDGVILAGDAGGFVDPMTGDGLRFAVRGGELAAVAALEALQLGWSGVHARLDTARRREFAAKWRFNRMLRAIVGSPSAIAAAAVGVRIAPAALRAVIAHAGDCHAPA